MTKGQKKMRMVTIHGSRELKGEEAVAVRLAASRAIVERAERARAARQASRPLAAPERDSVRKAMLLVEHQVVSALWTLARLPDDKGIGFASRNGVPYLPERIDYHSTVASGGKWDLPPPKPAPPSAKAIDAMHEPLEWLQFLDRDLARLLTVGAQSKRGDVSRNISWPKIRLRLPEFGDMSTRTLQRRYQDALRTIVSELSLARLSRLA